MEIWVGEDIFSPGESDHIKEACVVAVTAKLGPHVSPPKAEQSTRENVYEGDSARKLDQVSLVCAWTQRNCGTQTCSADARGVDWISVESRLVSMGSVWGVSPPCLH